MLSGAALGKSKSEKANLNLRRRELRQENKRYSAIMEPLKQAEWPATTGPDGGELESVWRSKDFLAQVYKENEQKVVRISIVRAALDNDGNFKADISWDDLQRIKNECGFKNHDAVEVYPAAADVVNVSNMRHLWVFQHQLKFAWRSDRNGL